MESSDASWHSFDPSAAAEDSEEMARLLGVQCLGNEQQQKTPLPSMYWPNHDHDQYYSSAPYFLHHHQPGPAAGYEGYYIGDGSGDGNEAAPDADGAVMAVDFFVPEEQMADPSSFVVDLNLDGGGEEPPACKRRFDVDQKDESAPRKKAMPKKGKNALSKKAQKGACGRGSDEAESNAEGNAQSWASYTSEEESQDVAGASTSSGKAPSARAGRGAATDPQSLYARKRRERINERLKILQNLVPNGTKVDISTMLEEAVHYVKFLQLQIKLLSSDELWMYAPIAYNGVNVGLDLKISPPQ